MSKIINHNRICLLIAVLAILAGTSFVFADDESADNSFSIVGVHQVENNERLQTVQHTFVLKADDPSYPMPEGAENGIKKVTVPSNEEFNFGEIKFPVDGTYEYTLSRELIQSDEWQQDDSVYRITISTFSDGTINVIYRKTNTENKSEKIEYQDKYTKLYTITFKLNGGTLNGKTDDIVLREIGDSDITIPDAPQKKGYEFLYWKGSKYYPGQKYHITEDHVFNAEYKELSSSDKSDNDSEDDNDIIARTGDDFRLILWGMMIVAAMITAVTALIIRKKILRKNNESVYNKRW